MSSQVTFVLVAVAVSLVVYSVQKFVFRRDDRALRSTIRRATRAMKALVHQRCVKAKVFTMGATNLDPSLLAVWVTTDTDKERDDLANDSELRQRLRAVLLQAGYPTDAVPQVCFAFESQQTVDRDFRGKWHYRMG